MRRGFWLRIALPVALGTFLGLLAASAFGQPPSDSTHLVGTVSAADHEIEDGYFEITADLALVAKPGSPLYRWLAAHRAQPVVVTFREYRRVAPETREQP